MKGYLFQERSIAETSLLYTVITLTKVIHDTRYLAANIIHVFVSSLTYRNVEFDIVVKYILDPRFLYRLHMTNSHQQSEARCTNIYVN